MSNINDKATVSLFVNGEQAEAAMDRLRQKAADLDKQLQTAMAAGDKKSANKLQRELDKVNRELNRTESAAKGTGIVLNNLANSSIHGLRNALRHLQKELSMTKPGSEKWQDLADKVGLVKSRISELNGELEGSQSLWGRFKKWAEDTWPAIDLLSRGYDTFIGNMREYVDAYAEMDQEMANVRKFTGMTAAQVEDLNEEFKKIDTRSSREQLNVLAQEAGRLGKSSKEDVLGYVRAADQINVALDDLGEGATLTLSKLTGVFGVEQTYGTEQSLLKVGSVVNELSQNCRASAPYLTDFAERMGGVGAQAGMTIAQIMGLGAVLDSNGLKVEASATAISQVLVRMMQDPAKYAKIAGLEVDAFTKKLRTDANGALLEFLDALNKAGGMDVLSPMFKDMGENGSRAITALSSLAIHIDEVKNQQEAAAVAFREGTSVGKEFDVQNTTVQAGLDKAKSKFHEMAVSLGEKLAPVMSKCISASSMFMHVLGVLVTFITENYRVLISLGAGYATYTAWVARATIADKAHLIVSAAHNAALKAKNALIGTYNIVMAASQVAIAGATNALTYFRNGLTVTYDMQVRARTAQIALNNAIKTNPLGLLLSIITTVITALIAFSGKTEEAERATKALADAEGKATEAAKEEEDALAKNIETIKTFNGTKEEEVRLIEALNSKYGAVLGTYKTLGEWQRTLTRNGEDYIAIIKRQIKAEAIQEQARQLYAEAAKKRAEADTYDPDFWDKFNARSADILTFNWDFDSDASAVGKWKLNSSAETLEKQAEILTEEYNKISDENKTETAKLRDELDARVNESLYETDAEYRERWDKISSDWAKNNNSSGSEHSFVEENNRLIARQNRDQAFRELNREYASKSDPATDPTAIGPQGTGYVSQVQAEKERKKQEAEARRAAAKAKKEFKDVLDSYKAQKSAADREALELYKSGSIDYAELLRRRHDNETKYYDDSLAHFEKTFSDQKDTYLQDDKDYQKILLDKEKADEKYEKNRVALALESIERRKSSEIQKAQHAYDVKSDPTVKDELDLQAELYRIRHEALDDKLALYTEGTKEYADTQNEIEALEQSKDLTQKEIYFKAVNTLRKEYDKKSAAERFKLEKAALDELLDAHILTDKQYAKYLKGLIEKYEAELPGSTDLGSKSSWSDNDQRKYEADKQALKDALSSNLLTQADYYRRLANLDREAHKQMVKGLKETGGEWNSMLADVYTSFDVMMKSLQTSPESFLGSLADSVAAVSAVVGAGMQIATEFAKAESQIQLAAIEKRYDREIELAQGNSYKVAKLEKQKEKETAKVKNEASKKQYAMQVVQAIAQSLIAGLNAYSSTLAIPVIGPALAPAAMAVALAMGATQVALLKKQQQAAEAQGYSKGGFTKPGAVDEPAGIVHAGEWVASQKLLASPVARPMIEALDRAQRTNTIGSLKPEDVSRSIRANDSIARIAEDGGAGALLVATMARNARAVDALVGRLNEPFVTINTVTGDHGIEQTRNEYYRLLNNITPKSKRKK